MIGLLASDGERFEVSAEVANQSNLLKALLENVDEHDNDIPIPAVTGPTLKRVIEHATRHCAPIDKNIKAGDEAAALEQWDKTFLGELSKQEVDDLLIASNYLDMANLLNLLCKHVAEIIKTMDVQEIRDYFGMPSDLTPEEQAQIEEETKWCMDTVS